MSNKPKPIRLTEAVKNFIVEKMSEGMTIAEINKKYPEKCPKPNSIYKKSIADDSWKEALDKGYTLWHYNKMEELDRLSSGLASEIYPGVEFKEAEAALKRRIDTLKFSLGKMAPVMSKRFDKAQKIEVEGNIGPTIQVLNYYSTDMDTSGKLEKDVTPALDDDTDR